MKKIIFICAMMFVSVQAMNAAEKTASDKAAPKASKECVDEKPETPSMESRDEMADYTVVMSSCGITAKVRGDQSAKVLCSVMDDLEAQCERMS